MIDRMFSVGNNEDTKLLNDIFFANFTGLTEGKHRNFGIE